MEQIFKFQKWEDCFAYEFRVRVGSAKKVARGGDTYAPPRESVCPELDERSDRMSQWTEWARVIYSSKTEEHRKICEVIHVTLC